MNKQQIAALGILLLLGYVAFAAGGYLVGFNVAEQGWQAKIDYVAFAEERVCHTRSRIAGDTAAIVAAERLTDGICADLREGEGAFATQVTVWRNTVPPDEWQGWHSDVLKAMEAIHQSYQHFAEACNYYDNLELDNSQAEVGLALGAMGPAIEAFKPQHRPWAH